MARINVIIRELDTGKIYEQMNNQGNKHLPDLQGEDYDKMVYDLIERTSHRVFGPNGMVALTGFKAKGKDAGFRGIAGHKVRGRPHLFGNSRDVVITFEVDGKPYLRALTGPTDETTTDMAKAG